MKPAVCALLAAFVLVPLAVVPLAAVPPAAASRIGPEPYRRPHVATEQEQRRAIAMLLRRGDPVYCGSDRGNAVALTFDDGPGPYTGRILGLLRAANARATFFLVGNRLHDWSVGARDDVLDGVVGNHTWSHAHLPELPRWLVWLELARTQWAEAAETGSLPRLVRVPYEERSPMTDGVAESLGLLQVLWSVDSGDDVRRARTARIVRTVLEGLHPGAIVLMHELHPWTVRALPTILRAIRLRGLRAVTVPELLALQTPAASQRCLYPSAPTPGD
jgi:peptidoglycan/xylan/chitin deacetylase (PgdA/CDA1 family)